MMNTSQVFRLPTMADLRYPRRIRRAGGPRIMLLTSGLGTGHTRAATAIECAVKDRAPWSEICTVDFWSLLDSTVAAAIQQTYLRLVTDRPDLYQRLYQLDQHSWRDILERDQPLPPVLHELEPLIAPLEEPYAYKKGRHWLDCVLYRQLAGIFSRADRETSMRDFWQQAAVHRSWRLLARRLLRRIEQFMPDVVVATQTNMAALAAYLKAQRQLTTPLFGIITDYGIHDFWLQGHIDCYCVADASLTERLVRAAHREVRVCVTGIPLMPGFSHPPSLRAARQQLGLPLEQPVVLILGGGLGLGLDSVVKTLTRSLPAGNAAPILVMLAGRNQSLVRELERDPAIQERMVTGQVRIQGWTEDTVTFIRAADIVIGKPGGLTTAEVLACGRPLLSTCSLRGQESFNVAYLENNGVGQLLGEERLARRVLDLLDDDLALERMQARAWDLGQRHGAGRIAAQILRMTSRVQPDVPAMIQ